MIEMDPEIGALLLPGMTVTGLFSSLSDGSWCVCICPFHDAAHACMFCAWRDGPAPSAAGALEVARRCCACLRHTFSLSEETHTRVTVCRYFAQPGYVWPSYYFSARSRGAGPGDGSLSDPESSDGEDYEY